MTEISPSDFAELVTEIVLPGVKDLGWRPDCDLTLDEWLALAEPIRCADRRIQALYWAIGDWLLYGEERFGEAWSQAEAVLGRQLSMGTLSQIMHVARNVPPAMRRADLPFWHHREVIPLVTGKDGADRVEAVEHQAKLLERAAAEEMTRRELGDEVRRERKRERWGDGADVPSSDARVVWATPPWTRDGDDGMGLAEMKRRGPRGAADSVLLLWAEPDRLPAAIELVGSWGYSLKGVALWDRPAAQRSAWVAYRHRMLLVCARGQVPDPGELLQSPFQMLQDVEDWQDRWFPGERAEWP